MLRFVLDVYIYIFFRLFEQKGDNDSSSEKLMTQ